MLKNILKLDGAQELSKSEQKSVSGGLTPVPPGLMCCEWIVRCGMEVCAREAEVCGKV